MQCACVVLSSVVCPVVPFFLLINFTVFEKKKKKVADHKICFDFLYNLCLKHISFWEELSEMSEMSSGLLVKYLLFLSDIKET